MRIAVISDTHNRYPLVSKALQLIEERQADLIIHCGDIEDECVVEQFPAHTHFVFGNCDHDKSLLRQTMKRTGATLHEPFGTLDIDGVSLAFIHGDNSRMLRELENSDFDYVFHGHTHVANEHVTGSTRVINPGALHRVTIRTFLILDLPSGATESVVVE